MWSERPRFKKLLLSLLLLLLWDLSQTKAFRDMGVDERCDLGRGYLHPVVEDAVQQQALAVSLGQRPFEVDNDRIDTMHLLVGIRIAFPYRHDQHKEFGVLLGDLRKNLDEVEGPIAPGILPGVCQPIVPGLELIEDQDRGLF